MTAVDGGGTAAAGDCRDPKLGRTEEDYKTLNILMLKMEIII